MSHESDGPKKGEVNPYIPKYISAKPWYQSEGSKVENDKDYLAHQRKNKDEIVDFSEAQAGSGIHDSFEVHQNYRVKKNEDFDSKRDRWYGFESDAWDEVLQNWERINQAKRQKLQNVHDKDYDSDDTDYELELVELKLNRKDLHNQIKEDPLEKIIRDRQDVPSYIYNITANAGNKIRIDYDPKSRQSKDLTKGLLNDENQFVKKSGDALDYNQVQRFAWEENRKDQLRKQTELIGKSAVHGAEATDPTVNLDLSLEASPTLMSLKSKQLQQEKMREAELRKKALLDKYGQNASAIKSEELRQITEVSHDFNEASTLDANGLKRSKYLEDKLDLDHQFIYGSYYTDGKWGYKCCKQTNRNAYCVAEEDQT